MEGFGLFQENQQSYESVRRFGYSLFAQNIHDKNPVLSPVSAYLTLSMAGCGACGATKEEFYNMLGKDMLVLTIDMMNTLPAEGAFLNLSFANSAWVEDKFMLNSTWISAIKCLMNAETFQAPLSAAETMNVINRWIAVKTKGMIDQLLEEPLDSRTKFALFHTVYFKGNWVFPFEPYDTHKEVFYLNKGQNAAVQVNMMSLRGHELEYISDNFTEGVILPYKNNEGNGSRLAFAALKPKGNANIRNICSRLTGRVMRSILANRQKMKIDLKLPKFEITFGRILNRSLANMGLLRCLDMKRADLTRIGRNLRYGENLYIDIIGQKARIVVDENGTEAAVSEFFGSLNAWEAQKELCFNEPFLYMIMDMDKEIPLFIGVLDNPVA